MRTRRVPRSLLWLCYLYVASLPFFGFSLFNWNWEGRGIARPDWLLGATLVVVFGFNLLTHRIHLRHSPANQFVVFYIFSGLLSAINLFNATNAQLIDFGTKAAQLLLVTAVFFVISSLPVSEQELKNVVRVWFLVASMVAAYALYQLCARLYGWPFAYLTPTANPTGRQSGRAFAFTVLGGPVALGRVGTLASFQYAQVSSFFREPTYLGSYLLSALILFGVLIVSNRGHMLLSKSSRLNWLFLSILLLGLLLSVALGPYFSSAATLGLMYALRQFYRLRITRLILLLLGLLFLGGLLFSAIGIEFFEAVAARVSGLFGAIIHGSAHGTSFPVRLEYILAALKVWAHHPVFGVGLNNTHYYTPEGIELINNGWVQLLSAQGLIGFTAMVLVFWSLLRSLGNLLRKVDPSSWWYFLIVGLIFVLVSDIIDTFITFNWTHTLRWFTLAIANLVYIRARSEFS